MVCQINDSRAALSRERAPQPHARDAVPFGAMDILILNGPNLNLLGRREPGVYGNQSFEAWFAGLPAAYPEHAFQHFQSNHEGALIDRLHADGFTPGGVVINAGGLSHTSVALADAVRAISRPVVAVHISNTFAREAFRHTDLLAPACAGLIAGLGLEGYRLAVEYLIRG